ncbi:arginine deiminase [Lactobacillus sp. ESL0236]|uniref:arginine deiminase n=1 Tax=unclassified Lactobacillus TaxID=2620435 RepID=UPI000EFB46F0|nr:MULTISPECIES: arginine deiminase [unclassified Lactobacillus]RMC38740.1 arginine deiminase [Lactobacillus sp. ESL0237]RMC43085.1 arginine deiminase [Lactobacillus sp. ESL0234]RMC43939.1 arginine deiminase [Lactobacillus sp. ESL0236]
MENPAINVNSEIGKLKTVLLKRPGAEVENITPDTMENLLFDDIPYLKIAQEEHDYFAETLRKNGVETLYIDDLAVGALGQSSEIRQEFIKQYLSEHGYEAGVTHDVLQEYLNSFDLHDMVTKLYSGIRRNEIDLDLKNETLHDLAGSDANDPFLLDPLPNAYFTRDPQASIGSGITINHMTFKARQPESLFTEFVMKYHPRFAGHVNVWRDRNHSTRIEGGDELVLNDHVLAIGVSQRTSSKSIEGLAQELFTNNDSHFDTVVAIEIPHNHAMMHLDTVFTMVNKDQFTVFPGIMDEAGKMNIFVMTPDENGKIKMEHHTDLGETLKQVLHLSELDLIMTGNADDIVAPREQWNDGSNTLTIAPGEVVTYNRNYVSNEMLREHDILVHEVISSELSRGRGGPRCMSQPLWREDL